MTIIIIYHIKPTMQSFKTMTEIKIVSQAKKGGVQFAPKRASTDSNIIRSRRTSIGDTKQKFGHSPPSLDNMLRVRLHGYWVEISTECSLNKYIRNKIKQLVQSYAVSYKCQFKVDIASMVALWSTQTSPIIWSDRAVEWYIFILSITLSAATN